MCFFDGAFGSFLSYGAFGGSSPAGLGGAVVTSGHTGNGGHLLGGHSGGLVIHIGHLFASIGFSNDRSL